MRYVGIGDDYIFACYYETRASGPSNFDRSGTNILFRKLHCRRAVRGYYEPEWNNDIKCRAFQDQF